MNLELQSTMRHGDQEAFLQFLGDHAIAHVQYQQAMFTQTGVQIPGFDMAELGKPEEWALAHYEIHRAINSVLRLAEPSDLLQFDIERASSFYDWTANHQNLHDITDAVLGLK